MSSDEFRTIWLKPGDAGTVQIIDQRQLPHDFVVHDLGHWSDGVEAISDMYVRGAPLIGVTAAYGMCLALRQDPSMQQVRTAAARLLATRPTAVNLRWALDEMVKAVQEVAEFERVGHRQCAKLKPLPLGFER